MDPDVVGYRFDAAKEKLARQGVTVVECVVTGSQQGRHQYVIRQREVAEKAVAIVVAYLGSEPPC